MSWYYISKKKKLKKKLHWHPKWPKKNFFIFWINFLEYFFSFFFNFLYGAKYLNSKKKLEKIFIDRDFWEIRHRIFRKISKNFIIIWSGTSLNFFLLEIAQISLRIRIQRLILGYHIFFLVSRRPGRSKTAFCRTP